MQADRMKGHLALLGANLFYGAGFTVAKMVMPEFIQPNGFILIRIGIVTILFWSFWLLGSNYRQTIEKRDWFRIALCGLFGVAANQLLFFLGLNLTSPIHASLMMLSTPILVSLFAVYALREKLTLNKLLGLCLGIIGAFVLIRSGSADQMASKPLQGDLLVLLNATSYAIYLVMVKPLMQRYRPLVIIRWVFLAGLIYVLPFSLIDMLDADCQLMGAREFSAIAFVVIGCTFFTYLWNMYALRVLPPTTAGAYIYLQPVFAAIIAVLVAGEQLSLLKVLASTLIFVGVYLAGLNGISGSSLFARLKK